MSLFTKFFFGNETIFVWLVPITETNVLLLKVFLIIKLIKVLSFLHQVAIKVMNKKELGVSTIIIIFYPLKVTSDHILTPLCITESLEGVTVHVSL